MSDEEVAKAKKEGKSKEEIERMYYSCEAWMYSTLQKYLLDSVRNCQVCRDLLGEDN